MSVAAPSFSTIEEEPGRILADDEDIKVEELEEEREFDIEGPKGCRQLSSLVKHGLYLVKCLKTYEKRVEGKQKPVTGGFISIKLQEKLNTIR